MPFARVGRIDTGSGLYVQLDAGTDNSVYMLTSENGRLVTQLDADGSQTIVQAYTDYAQFVYGGIETLSNGGYALYATNFSGYGWDMRVRTFGSDGAATSELTDPAFEGGEGHTLSGYALSATGSGGYVVAWNDISRSGDSLGMTYPTPGGGGSANVPAGYDDRIRFFGNDGTALTPSVIADDDVENVNGTTVSRRAGDQYVNDLATLTGGQSVFVYEDTRWVTNANGDGAQPELVISMQIMSQGNVGEPIQVDLGGFGDRFGNYPNSVNRLSYANAVPLPDGNFAVLWTESVYQEANVWGNYAFQGWVTLIRYFDASGNALGDPIQVAYRDDAYGNHSKQVFAEALPDGRIVIAYNDGEYGANGNGYLNAYVSVLSAYGGVVETTRVNQGGATNGQFYNVFDIAARSDGTFEVVYNDAHREGDYPVNHTVIERMAPSGGSVLSGNSNSNTLAGDATDNSLFGLGGNDQLSGGDGMDSLYGADGNDRLSGGTGADKMYGGTGNDSYVVDNAGDVVNEATDQGTDTVESSISYTLGANLENLKLTGTGAIDGTGNALANALTGNGQANHLDGGAGADTMTGGTGDDRYVVDDAGDKVIEANGGGSDTVDSTVSFTLAGQYVEVLNLAGAEAINGTGNGLDNRITGNSAANSLNGGAGNDKLDGGLGADKLTGGVGNDTYVVDDAGDVVTELANEGTDTVESSISFSLAGRYIETLKLTGTGNINATGNGLANTLVGNAGNNVINGGAGADSMTGGAGDDRFIVDDAADKVFEVANQGTDTIESSVTFTLAGQYVENLTLTGAAAINGTGNGLANVLTGNAAANTLNGGTGDDALHGGLGSDTLTGGAGLDHYWFETTLGAGNVDNITDFSVADDTIDLDRSIFTGIAANGALASGAFVLGTVAGDANDRILYDKATGNIWYDADGTGATAAVLFAHVTANTNLTAADFFGQP